MMFSRKDRTTPTATDAHDVLDTPMLAEPQDGEEVIFLAMGCFWGAERIFWKVPGVVTTAVGYMGGTAPDPSYEQVCSGTTGHTEIVRVVFDPRVVSAEEILKAFWENHDPTTANRQGNDVGTQYRSGIYWTTPAQERAAEATKAAFQQALTQAGRGTITTEILSGDDAGPFWPAEAYHQQYLSKNPGGYCNHGHKGITCPIGVANLPAQTDVLPPD